MASWLSGSELRVKTPVEQSSCMCFSWQITSQATHRPASQPPGPALAAGLPDYTRCIRHPDVTYIVGPALAAGLPDYTTAGSSILGKSGFGVGSLIPAATGVKRQRP